MKLLSPGKPRILLCLLTTILLSSCAEIRLLTYPADFTWIGKEQAKSTMHAMANSVSELNALLQADLATDLRQNRIVEELDLIESYALTLSGETSWSLAHGNQLKSKHLLLSDNMDEFISIVGQARLQAQAEPANYYGIGKITGGCSSCHRIR